MRWARAYFAAQALAGAAWWVGVFTLPWIRTATLGGLDPVVVAVLDIPLFVVASAAAALGLGVTAIVATAWTCLVALAMAVYATATGEAGWGALVMIAAALASVISVFLVILGRVPTERLLLGPLAFRSARPRRRPGAHVAFTAAQTLCFWGSRSSPIRRAGSSAERARSTRAGPAGARRARP